MFVNVCVCDCVCVCVRESVCVCARAREGRRKEGGVLIVHSFFHLPSTCGRLCNDPIHGSLMLMSRYLGGTRIRRKRVDDNWKVSRIAPTVSECTQANLFAWI